MGRQPAQQDVLAELRASEERLRLVQAAGRVGSFDWNILTGEIHRTPEYLEIQGLPRDLEEASRYSDHWQERLHPDDRERVVRGFEDDMARGGYFHHEYRIVRPSDGEVRWLENRGRIDHDGNGRPVRLMSVQSDITERKRDEARLRLLVNELNHRVKNTLATVQSVASQSLRNAVSLAEARDAFEARLMALSRAHDVLTERAWVSADLAEIVRRATEAYADRAELSGGSATLAPGVAVSIAMALHELSANAFKYGALSRAEGHVAIAWGLEDDRLWLTWREEGGPPVSTPTRRGFGSRLIEEGLARELGGRVSIDYAPGGVRCRIEAPLNTAPPEAPE